MNEAEALLTDPASITGDSSDQRGRIVTFDPFESSLVSPRRIDVWLPAGYDEDAPLRYPVLYAHDGQNLFDPASAYAGVAWELDQALVRVMSERRIPGALIVGIWNTHERISEYMPQKALDGTRFATRLSRFEARYGRAPHSDDYLRFIVDELRPFVDRRFRTRTAAEDTVLIGSSMGALVSLYGVCEHPDVFGGVACLSTSWTIGGQALLEYLKVKLPAPGRHRMYFDHGGEAQIARYERFQRRADEQLLRSGYRRDIDWMSLHFPGEEHSERAWRARLDLPLRFLLDRSKS